MARKLVVVAMVLGMVVAGTALALADPPGSDSSLPEHPHVLLLGAEVDFSADDPVLLGARKCVDLAANRALPLNAHHAHIHFGSPGEALFEHAGHIVAPAQPFPVPWSDCESMLAFFGL